MTLHPKRKRGKLLNNGWIQPVASVIPQTSSHESSLREFSSILLQRLKQHELVEPPFAVSRKANHYLWPADASSVYHQETVEHSLSSPLGIFISQRGRSLKTTSVLTPKDTSSFGFFEKRWHTQTDY